jgi:tRNA A37 threonylcarbamoyladenosine dehydratase
MIRNSHVAVVGLGGVGSHSAIMLARGGVEHLTLVDFDMVTVSSLNRHACAALRDVGIPKVTCVANAIQDIAGEGTVDVAAHVEMLTGESAPRLIPSSEVSSSLCSKPISMVVDAIDDVPTKAALISHCLRHKIRVISCMGAGGKADVTRLHVSDLRTASRDPLASKLRQFLKKDFLGGGGENGGGDASSYLDDMSRLTIVYSTEKIVAKLADFTDEQREEGVHRFGAIDGMRIRVVPVLGTMPAVMGQSLAAVALTELGRKPFQPVAGERVGRSTRHTTLQRLNAREKRIEKRVLAEAGLDALPDPSGCRVHGTWIGPTQVDDDDVEYLLEIWRNRCGISNARLGASLELVRWKASEPAACDNLVLMSAATVKRYDQEGKQWISPDAQRRVHERLATCQLDR